MGTYQIISILILLTAIFALVNDRFIKWPPTIGIMVLSLFTSIFIVIIGNIFPQISARATRLVGSIDFGKVLLEVMLSFLLFAGAIHIDAGKLKKVIWPVAILATLGIFISAFLVGVMAYYLFSLMGIAIPFIYCLLFGALISPTDPIAVMAILKKAGISPGLELKIAGESLFNDGVGVVLFLTILEVAAHGNSDFSVSKTLLLFLQEAGGGILFGFVLGYLAHLVTGVTDNYRVEVLITLAVVMCGYMLADSLHLSGPLAIIVTGIVLGTRRKRQNSQQPATDYLIRFWDLTDEIFNAILFLLLGLEILVIRLNLTALLAGTIMIFVVLLARWISVLLPVLALRKRISFAKNSVAILTWGGLRGGLSVAMALSLPAEMHRDTLVLVTYVIVVFAIVVQGLTIGKVARRLMN